MKPLTQNQWNQLDYQYQNTPDLADGNMASGEHYLLVSVLNGLGYYPNSRADIMDTAERVLANGYQ